MTVQSPVVSRPASGPRSEGAVPSVPSMITRSSLKPSNVPGNESRNVPNRLVPGQNEVPRPNNLVQGQAEGLSQAYFDQTYDQLMQRVADCDYPGNILTVLHKPSAPSTHVADSGSKARAESGRPASVRVRDQPVGAGGVQEGRGRLDIRSVSQLDKAVVQVDGQLREPSPQQFDGALPGSSLSLGQSVQVGLPDVRRSNRQRSQISPYQAGTSGMEGSLDSRS